MYSATESIINVFILSLGGNIANVWDDLNLTNHDVVGKFHTFLFLAIVHVLLVNLLIAMMGDTYTKIAEIKNEWMRQVGFRSVLQERER